MKNKVLVMVLAMVLVFSCTAAAFADSGIQPYATGRVTFLIDRTSGTSADVDASMWGIVSEQSKEKNKYYYSLL